METVEQIGSFLGIAAFFALAILAMLLFQLGRDVRRLRDWAGRAPERAAVAAERASQDYSEQAADLRRLREESTGETFWTTRNISIAAVGAVVFAIGVFVGISSLFGGDGSQEGAEQASGQTSRQDPNRIVPGTVRVAVLNGTAEAGLAATVGATVEENGFQLGAVTNTDQQFELSVVMYARGHKREADLVGEAIGFGRVRMISGEVRGVAQGANVVAIVGRDRIVG